jgi:hypothetical protein
LRNHLARQDGKGIEILMLHAGSLAPIAQPLSSNNRLMFRTSANAR